jgi:carbon monoxide dehydrogenase subunit G
MNFETRVRIERPIEDVFDYVSDPQNFPRWNSAVQAVRATSPGEGDVGSTYLMERELPGGRAENELEIVGRERPTEFAMRTTSGPTPFVYRYRFVPEGGATVVHLAADVELPGIAGALGPLAARAVKKGVDANFATLKQILEATAGEAGSASV